MIEELQKLYDHLDSKNEEILKESQYCRNHKFGLEADSLYQKYSHGRSILLELRIYINKFK